MTYQMMCRHTHKNQKFGYLMVGDSVETEDPREALNLVALRGGTSYGATAYGVSSSGGPGYAYFSAINFDPAELRKKLESGEKEAENKAKAKAEAEAKAKAEADKAAAEAKAKEEAEAKKAAEKAAKDAEKANKDK